MTRRRHVIVASKRPASQEATPAVHTTPATTDAVPATLGDTRIMTSEQLFAGQSAVTIQHNGAMYTLRVTRFGKLILTK